MTPLNWAEGVPIGMSSAIYHDDTVALMTRLMKERGLPVDYHTFHGQKAGDEPVAAQLVLPVRVSYRRRFFTLLTRIVNPYKLQWIGVRPWTNCAIF